MFILYYYGHFVFQVSQKILITKLTEKYDRVLKYCEKEVDKIMKMFKRQKDDPPLPRNYSPVAGQRSYL